MGESTRLTLADLERAIALRDPQLGELLVRYLEQDDPEPGRSELEPHGSGDDSDVTPDVPAGAYTIDRLQRELSEGGLRGKNATEKKLARREAFAAAERSPFAPPRLRLGTILVDLYEQGDAAARGALIHLFANARMEWGVWQAAKRIYKLAEERHDAALFGVLAYRFDAGSAFSSEIGGGTRLYLKRRAWRYLRQLGRAVPDAYATFCVEVLRHYPSSFTNYSPSWVAAQIWSHGSMRYARDSWTFQPPPGDGIQKRAYPEAWKLSPAPALRLLEVALNELVCDFAIRALRADHPLALRAVDPAWLAQLGLRPIAAIHAFVVQLLKESPELHQSKLRALGLHDVVIAFLRSPSKDARAYALEYAAAHAPDISVADLVMLVEIGADEVKKFAGARLEVMTPQQLGVGVLTRLLAFTLPWVPVKLAQGYGARDIDAAMFVDTASYGANAYNALVKFFNDKGATIPAAYFTTLLDDPRFDPSRHYQMRGLVNTVWTELGKRSARDIGIAWIQRSFEDRPRTAVVARWLEAGMLSGADLDVDWLKTLVGKPRLRPYALRLLADRRYVEPARVGLSWLLELARSSDGELATFAQRMLLESFTPADFGGVDRVWELATGKKQPESVRQFAATYLKAHHPELGPRLPEARALGIKPRLTHSDYSLPTIRALLRDARADVRRLAVAIAGEDIVRWNDAELVYELAGSAHPEPRGLGIELMMGVIVEGATRKVPAAWIDGRRLFQLAESTHKAAREAALTLIRRLYDQVGGAERLGWLMDSPDRDVRLFAVRLFWDRHRPKPWPDDYAPRKHVGAPIGTQRFSDLPALRQFARTVLFGLPPGRIAARDPLAPGAPQPERPLPASVAKRRLIEAMRDIGLEDVEFARAIAPVLGEFTESVAKGEWQASVQALTALRAKHGAEAFTGEQGAS